MFTAAVTMLMPILTSLAGCGSNNDVIKEDKAAETARVESAGKMRGYFDKSKGNYDALSAEDKAALDKLTGSEAKSREAFGHMVLPGAGLPQTGPGAH